MQKISISWQVNKLTSRRVACYFIRKSPFFTLAFVQVDELTSLQVDELLVILYVNPRSFILCFLQVDELTSLQVDELLVILYANLRSLTWFFGRQLVHLSSCSLVHLFFFKYMFSCYFVSFLQVDKLTSLQVYELLVILYANSRSFILCFFASWRVNKSTSIRVACYSIRQFSFFYLAFLQVDKFTSLQVYELLVLL